MKQMQEKSPCCKGQIRRFGRRRRQCGVCYKTWRVWSKKRGRKVRRSNDKLLLQRYLNRQLSITVHANRRDTPGRGGLEARLRTARDEFVATTKWTEVPNEPSILIADAFEETIKGITRTGYLGFVRAATTSQAVILPPYYRAGTETAEGWEAAFASYGQSLSHVSALVCDGANGLIRQAKQRGWVLQRCHFHIWHSLNNYIRIPKKGRTQPYARLIHGLVAVVLESPNDEKAYRAICRLQALLPELRSRGARKVISGLTRNWLDSRSYIYCADLGLPRTSNCAEQGVCIIRRLQQNARGWSSHASFTAWAEAALKHTQTVSCPASEISTKLI